MAKAKGTKTSNLPFTLYAVRQSEENTHAGTTFLHCTSGFTFAVAENGYCSPGELLLAQWTRTDQLQGLAKASVTGRAVMVGRCIKGAMDQMSVPLSSVEDVR